METLAYQMLQARLPEGLISVGTQVQISHMAPTPVGNTLRIQAKVSQIDSRRLTFTLQAWDEAGLVGEATHTRVVVERQRFIQNVKAKLGSR